MSYPSHRTILSLLAWHFALLKIVALVVSNAATMVQQTAGEHCGSSLACLLTLYFPH